jgi:poly(3-hydroxybutyrate) depolymerase
MAAPVSDLLSLHLNHCRSEMRYLLLILTVVFQGMCFFAHAQYNEVYTPESWMQTITRNAIKPGAPNGSFAAAPYGFALYFSKAGDLSVPYIVYVPKGYDPSRPAPMVVFLHGAILAREQFQYKETSIAKEPVFSISDTFHCLVVFPFAKNDFAWGRNEPANENIMTIIQQVENTYNVDHKRIYIGGISMGGNATFWFITNKANSFAGFYTFSALPGRGGGDVNFKNITRDKPLYSMNAKDDQTFSFNEAKQIYNQHKSETPGWHFNEVASGGHRFIYGTRGTEYVKSLVGQLLIVPKR